MSFSFSKGDWYRRRANKESESIFQSLKTTVKKWLGGTYFNENLYDVHKYETIKAMLYEIRVNDEIKFKTLESATNYLDSVVQGLKKNFKDNKHLNQVSSIKIKFLKIYLMICF